MNAVRAARRQLPGAVPTASAKDREKYSCEAKPHLAAIWAMERSLVRSSCLAASMRVAAMVFWTVVPSAFLKAASTVVCERPRCAYTSDAVGRFAMCFLM